MNGNIIGTLVVLVILIAGGWYLFSGTTAYAPIASETSVATSTATIATTTPVGVTVTYDTAGFSPTSVTVPVGTSVTFVNQGSGEMWVASDLHPTHESYDGTTRSQHCIAGYNGPAPFDECAAGSSYRYTFLKVGTWGYHNHVSAGDRGTVIVTEAAPVSSIPVPI